MDQNEDMYTIKQPPSRYVDLDVRLLNVKNTGVSAGATLVYALLVHLCEIDDTEEGAILKIMDLSLSTYNRYKRELKDAGLMHVVRVGREYEMYIGTLDRSAKEVYEASCVELL
jgi:hypothetical protein